MNRKGFTLIEVLAVIIILGIMLVVAVPGISNVYKNSKLKSEQIFTNRLTNIIDGYVKLNTDEISFTSDGTANKTEEGSSYTVTIYRGKENSNQITFQNVINDNLMSSKDYINSGNKDKQCNLNAEIEVYRDSDFVYCHKVEATSLNCLTEEYIKSICPEPSENCYVIDTCIWSR